MQAIVRVATAARLCGRQIGVSGSCLMSSVSEGKSNKGAAQQTSGFVRTEAGLNELYMRAVEPKPHAIPKMSPEESAKGKKLADTYTKLMWKRHHVMNRDLQRKIKLKWAAIAALPTAELKSEALELDPYVPLWSRVPAATPPSKGFHGETVDATAPTVEDSQKQAPKGVKAKEDKKKAVQTSLAAAVRRGRGRDEDDDESLFSLGSAPAASDAAPKGGKK